MRIAVYILCLLCAVSTSFAQDGILLSNVEIFGELRLESIAEARANRQGTTANLRWIVVNDLDSAKDVYLRVPSADSVVVHAAFLSTDTTFVTGPYVRANSWLFPEDPAIVPLRIQAGQQVKLNVWLWSARGRPFSVKNVSLQSREFTLGQSLSAYRQFAGRTEFNGFFLGAVVFAMLFSLLIWARTRQLVFLYYGLYLLGAGIYSLVVKSLPYSYLARAAYMDLPLTYKLGEPVQYLFFGAYIAFAVELLDIDHRYLTLSRVARLFTYLLLVCGGCLLIYNLFRFDYLLQQKAFLISRMVILPVALMLLSYIVWQVQSPVKWFFVVGSSLFFLGGLLAVVVDPKSRHLFFGVTTLNPVNFFKTGILLECLCFALALGVKIRIQQKQRDYATRAYIDQLELNRQMTQSENERLESMVRQRSEEILEKNLLIEKQKQSQMRSDLQKQIAEMEMRALRSQMNPHFIFNSLNSIRYQIMKKDYDQAVLYLTRFSKLLRYILQNSREHVIALSEEIEMNRLYMQLESLRFSQGFEFILQIPESIDTSQILIPPMLLQPYIENAVKHGLVPSARQSKTLRIEIKEMQGGCRIIVEDNGVGRKASSLSSKFDGKQSLGIKIACERIELFNAGYHPVIQVLIEDLFEDREPSGTRVMFNYKYT